MQHITRFFIVFIFFLSIGSAATAQMIQDPTTWKYEVKKKNDSTYDLIFRLNLKEHWHIYALNPGGDGMEIPPKFSFDNNPIVKAVGKIKEIGKKVSIDIDGIDGTVHYFLNNVSYVQTVHVKGNTEIKGKHSYQVCDESMCLPSKKKSFSFRITDFSAATPNAETPSIDTNIATADTVAASVPNDTSKNLASVTNTDKSDQGNNKKQQQRGLLWLFFMALGGGIAAVITPCVYSMIPITVSFFTKRSKTRSEGIKNAVWYSLSIILIFTILGVLISAVFGANALNNLSTNWIANLIFFIIFILFGISFLGAFEITLPSSWTSKTDSKAGIGSFSGIFFMALTLVIVSFSCTGPIVGPLLVLAGSGGIAGPAVGMFGFSLGLALPFALFAVFPGLLNKIATSGGWLNQVKVVLGFIELMLAMKFLSNADLAQGWRLLDREIYIAIWIVLSVLLGLYLLGRLKLSHDDASPKNIYGQEYVSIFKLFLAIVSFTFAVYLLPGMWGAPLNGMSQFLPPMGTQDYVVSNGGGAGSNHAEGNSSVAPQKYVKDMKIYEPPVVVQSGLVTYYDYEEALNAAKILKKPVMLDFTGINCVNCRKMESQVWSQPEVMKRLKEDFIIASLYCDYDKIELPKDQQFFSKELNSQVVTLGDWNEHLQASKFNSNSQPFYFYVDENGNKLVENGYSYDPDVQKFVDHLEKVKEAYRKSHN
ncbi:MAG TPA: cytochrome c biogenesis protein CcdA [Flavipsychrobacter sp.]|nr:cytochrome c biogenesis protein CcdA [Flavipsychrobacter sp.]